MYPNGYAWNNVLNYNYLLAWAFSEKFISVNSRDFFLLIAANQKFCYDKFWIGISDMKFKKIRRKNVVDLISVSCFHSINWVWFLYVILPYFLRFSLPQKLFFFHFLWNVLNFISLFFSFISIFPFLCILPFVLLLIPKTESCVHLSKITVDLLSESVRKMCFNDLSVSHGVDEILIVWVAVIILSFGQF